MQLGIHRTSTRLALGAAGAVLALAAAGCGSSSRPVSRGTDTVAASIPVAPANPYYPLLAASSQPTVAYGAKVGGCEVKPMARCPGARLPGAMLQGALLGGADLTGADLSGSQLALATFSGATLTGADLSHTTLTGAALNRVSGKGLSPPAPGWCSRRSTTPVWRAPISRASTPTSAPSSAPTRPVPIFVAPIWRTPTSTAMTSPTPTWPARTCPTPT